MCDYHLGSTSLTVDADGERVENANVFKNAILSRFLLNPKEGNIRYIENTKKPHFGLIIAFLADVAQGFTVQISENMELLGWMVSPQE